MIDFAPPEANPKAANQYPSYHECAVFNTYQLEGFSLYSIMHSRIPILLNDDQGQGMDMSERESGNKELGGMLFIGLEAG